MRHITNAEFEAAYRNQDNKNVIKSVLDGYASQIDPHDLESCGMAALWRALAKHNPNAPSKKDPSRPCHQKFTTTLYRYTNWACKRQLEKDRRFANQKTLPSDMVADLDSNPAILHLRDCVESLPDQDRTLIQQRYYDRMTFDEIGQANGFSRGMARQRTMKAFAMLRSLARAA